jgi:hypothetical protein
MNIEYGEPDIFNDGRTFIRFEAPPLYKWIIPSYDEPNKIDNEKHLIVFIDDIAEEQK